MLSEFILAVAVREERHCEDMAPFYSVPLIGSQVVNGGENSWLSCLMSYFVCFIKLEGDYGPRGSSI